MNTVKLIEKAKEAGIETLEIYIKKASKESIKIYDQKVDNFTIAQSGGIALRGIYEGKLGYCFLEEDSDENIDFCIRHIKENAKAIESKDMVMIYEGSKSYPTVEVNKEIEKYTSADKIEFLKKVEEKAKEADPRIVQVMETMMETQKSETRIMNSLGLDIVKEEEYAVFYSAVLASENKDNKSAYEIRVIQDLNQFDIDAYIEVLKEKAISKLNAKQVKSGKYPVILKNEVMCALLQSLSGLFSGEAAYKGISRLKDKLNEQIFDEKITILDDPLKKDGYSTTPFDDEGVASFTKTVVDHGKLMTFLHNQKSAAMMYTTSTGNGFKSGYSSSVGIQPTNFYIEKGNVSFEEMIQKLTCGIIIDEVNGLHAGLNSISTDFSLQASGYLIENGKISRPINLITVAGNFLDMMKNVQAVGNDPFEELSGIGSPSLLFDSLAISGE